MDEIIDLLKRRDESGLSKLYDRYAPVLFGVIIRIVQDKGLGEEILQQTFLKIWNNIESFNPEKGSLYSWMAVIARRSALDEVRLKGFINRKNVDYGVDMSALNHSSKSPLSSNLDSNTLLNKLDHKYREVLEYVYLYGYSHRDTAEILGLPLGTIKTRIKKAMDLLRSELQGEKSLFLGTIILIIITIVHLWS